MSSKKNFKADNPAMQYITQPTEPTQQTDKTQEQQDYEARERKTKRLNLVMKPTLLVDINKIATMKQTSVNDLINTILDNYIEQEAATIERYNKVFIEGEQSK